MFDISLGELAVIGVVALVVIGPEKLPKVARTAGLLYGRARRISVDFHASLEKEIQAAELADLRRDINETAVQAEILAEPLFEAAPEPMPDDQAGESGFKERPVRIRKAQNAIQQDDLFAEPEMPRHDAGDRR